MSPRCPHFLPNKRKVRRPYLDSHIFHILHATGRPPHTHLPLSINSQKTAKPASPRFAGYTPQPMSGCFPRASDPPYHYQAPKIRCQFRRDQRPAPQIPNQSSLNKHPEPALPVSANTRPIRPRHIQNLRHISANTRANQFTQILHTCEGGGVAGTSCMRIPARTRARPWACTRISVPWSYLHGFAHTCTAMVICLRVRLRRDQRPVHSNARPANSLKFPAPARGAWASATTASTSVGRCMSLSGLGSDRTIGPGGPMAGRLDSTKVRRCGVRAIGSAGRMTDHAGRRPDPARQKVDVDPRKVRMTPVTACG